MSELIRISVIIPTFNRATTIGYCIKSIINQTYQPYEIIIVDDCSTDRTIEVIKSFNDPKIRVIQLTKRSGAQAARNRGIYESKGEWIAFQDSDDEWRSNKLEEQIKVLNKEHNSKNLVIYTGAIYKNYKNGRYYNYPIPNISSKNEYKELLRNPGQKFQGILV